MKYMIKDNNGCIVYGSNKKEEIDFYIDVNSQHNEFLGFYWENDEMVIETENFDIIIKGE